MKHFLLLFSIAILSLGCGPQKRTQTDITGDRKAIETLITDFASAWSSRNPSALMKLLSTSPEFQFFGTDSVEVIKSPSQFEAWMTFQLQFLQSMSFGYPRNLAVQISSDGEFASAFYEIPLDFTAGGKPSHALIRYAFVMKKEDGQWHLVQGLHTGAETESSPELVAALKSPKK